MSHISLEVFKQVQALLDQGKSFVIVTMLGSAGHTPQDPGAKILVTREGLIAGTIGGGKVEAKAIAMAVETLISKQEQIQPWIEHWNLQKDVGMSCGGSADILFECFQTRPWSIVVFGAGHVAQALIRILVQLDCRVSCLDPRPEWISKLPVAPQLDARCEEDMARFAADVPAQSYCVVVTKGHDSDLPILKELLPRKDLPYIGVIGSKVKARILRADLLREGFAKEQVESVYCPIGLPFGSNHPAEIAISIIAQLMEVRDKVVGRL